ncbi:MAG TPA: UDP-N-acetylmuramate dehydrogenase [Rhodocyclaceae bacterium]|nr:UDP-N-acetylmuramate dehydrogenase [Rhodocyclaceae bacterium]
MNMFPGFRGEVRLNEPMSRHVSWRAGGVAARVAFPLDLEDCAALLAALPPDEPVLMVGLGSNLLVRDGGFPGTVLFTHGALKNLRLEDDDSIYAEAGVASPKVARFAATQDLVGAEFLAGIPGTVGGALAMNAGCYGSETWSFVEKALLLNRRGEQVVRAPTDFEIGYRHVRALQGSDEIFVGAWFRFERGHGDVSRERIRTLLEKRINSQPLALPNAGSVFRNPPADHAARLIEAAGLKGLKLGGAQVSEKHANFIVNPQGVAKASEIEMLIGQIQAVVMQKFGVALECEVRIVGQKEQGKAGVEA